MTFLKILLRKLLNLLETKVKPVVASHGGDITFHSFNEGVVSLELKGSCSDVPHQLLH